MSVVYCWTVQDRALQLRLTRGYEERQAAAAIPELSRHNHKHGLCVPSANLHATWLWAVSLMKIGVAISFFDIATLQGTALSLRRISTCGVAQEQSFHGCP